MSRTEGEDEVDFSGGERGRFYRAGAVPIPPVHLDPDVLERLRVRAKERGVGLDELVNEHLRKALETA